ncbi:MAG: outer membrane lipoprotein carrier protein LolA [Deltaproteobacteria bacterium]|nr:outer membrane lipoprotein carrier protein LolA [Deltaproteobacteria bacterium]MBW2385592.1 outer membrane lipoprotein carrier protein LolA [Deltaproteobacteria bacterium]MBW2695200.1 outer membrane lipoprotein carrier protein LolA [Deltaproteobacteria bacterium]
MGGRRLSWQCVDSGRGRLRRAGRCIALVAAVIFTGGAADRGASADPSTAPAPETLEALMAHFARSGGVRARFDETRTLSILTVPIETEGFLYFSPPDRLARVTTHPGASTVVVHGTRVVFEGETGRHELDLASSDIARGLVGNLMVMLRGDLAELRARYAITYEAEGERWQLDLVPRSRDLRALVELVRVTGVGERLMGMETRETNGDATVTRFSEVESGLDFDADGSENVFSLESAGKDR